MKILKTMRAATVDGRGVVSIRELPVPSVGRREVLIAVDTAGVGSWDASMRPDSDDPLVPGTDGAGTVVAVGSRVRRFRVGDRVYSYSYENRKGGFHAEYVAVDAKKVARVPRGLDMKGAGAIATTGLTALQGVDDALHVKKSRVPVRQAARRASPRDRIRPRRARPRPPPRRRRSR
jgi:NADPH:quinone reductase